MRIEDAEAHARNIANVAGTRGNKAQQKHFHVSESEQAYLRALVAKHGDAYKQMQRDLKLNTQQLSAAKLRRRIARLAVFDKQQQGALLLLVDRDRETTPETPMEDTHAYSH